MEKRALFIQSDRLCAGSTHLNSNIMAMNGMFSPKLMNARRLGSCLHRNYFRKLFDELERAVKEARVFFIAQNKTRHSLNVIFSSASYSCQQSVYQN